MLDPWIIEEIKRREQSRRIEQPVIQIPAHGPESRDPKGKREKEKEDDAPPRGVEIIELGVGGAGRSYGW